MDMSAYRELFVSECRIHIGAFGELIVRLEESPDDRMVVDELFRHVHSLKGMASSMGYGQVVSVAHAMEDWLEKVRNGESRLEAAHADLLLEGSDMLGRLVTGIESGDSAEVVINGFIARMASSAFVADGELTVPPPEADGGEVPPPEPVVELQQFRRSDSFSSIRIKTETLDNLVNITGELITNRYRLERAVGQPDAADCRESLAQLSSLLRSLRDQVFKARMLPFAIIAERFPRLVRDLARQQDKDVHFRMVGKEIELDRAILEEIAEPIVHILRNAIDHGLETAEERLRAGKPPSGILILSVNRDKDAVEISIIDDGRGLDPELLKRVGVEKGFITAGEAAEMAASDAFQLICRPGFSTARSVTTVSGRGVGMDVVREAVHSLAGVLAIDSPPRGGSRFTLRLPITISIITVMVVRCGGFDIAIPLTSVVRIYEVKRSDIVSAPESNPPVPSDGSTPLRSFRQLLGLPELSGPPEELVPVVACDCGGVQVPYYVDTIVGQQEIFVRPLGSPLSLVRGISGATITGDGRVMFVMDMGDIG